MPCIRKSEADQGFFSLRPYRLHARSANIGLGPGCILKRSVTGTWGGGINHLCRLVSDVSLHLLCWLICLNLADIAGGHQNFKRPANQGERCWTHSDLGQ